MTSEKIIHRGNGNGSVTQNRELGAESMKPWHLLAGGDRVVLGHSSIYVEDLRSIPSFISYTKIFY